MTNSKWKLGSITGALLLLMVVIIPGCSSGENSVTVVEEKSSSVPVGSETVNPDTLPMNSFMPEIPRIGLGEVKAILDRDEKVLIIDSRDTKYYDESHTKGAISLPLDEMAEPYDSFEGYDEIITYCT